MSAIIFRTLAYIFFGLVLEITFTAISNRIMPESNPADGVNLGKTKLMRGDVSLFMIPIYASIVWMYEPIFSLMYSFNIFIVIRFLIWAVLISGIEALTGFIYDKTLKIRPWDYSLCKDKVFKNGYTRWTYVPMWGVAGIVIELYVQVLRGLSPHVQQVIDSIKFFI